MVSSYARAPRNVYTPFIAILKQINSITIGHDHPTSRQTASRITRRFGQWTGAALGGGRQTIKRGDFDVSGDNSIWMQQRRWRLRSPICCSSAACTGQAGRSGVVNLVAAHKWFNLAALKGRADAISMRREVAEMMSDVE